MGKGGLARKVERRENMSMQLNSSPSPLLQIQVEVPFFYRSVRKTFFQVIKSGICYNFFVIVGSPTLLAGPSSCRRANETFSHTGGDE